MYSSHRTGWEPPSALVAQAGHRLQLWILTTCHLCCGSAHATQRWHSLCLWGNASNGSKPLRSPKVQHALRARSSAGRQRQDCPTAQFDRRQNCHEPAHSVAAQQGSNGCRLLQHSSQQLCDLLVQQPRRNGAAVQKPAAAATRELIEAEVACRASQERNSRRVCARSRPPRHRLQQQLSPSRQLVHQKVKCTNPRGQLPKGCAEGFIGSSRTGQRKHAVLGAQTLQFEGDRHPIAARQPLTDAVASVPYFCRFCVSLRGKQRRTSVRRP